MPTVISFIFNNFREEKSLPEEPTQSSKIDQRIIDLVKAIDPETVELLISQVQLKYHLSKREILDHIINLQNEGKLALKNPPRSTPTTLKSYLMSSQSFWYWAVIALAAITTVLVFTVPEKAYALVYARYVLGAVFVVWLPGYTLIRALFPLKEIDNTERVALSIGTSLALAPITGLLLNYTPWGIRVTPITVSLLALTITLATAALIREQRIKQNQAQTKIELIEKAESVKPKTRL